MSTTISLENRCPYCNDHFHSYFKPQTLLNHLRSTHQVELPSRKSGVRRPFNKHYRYEDSMDKDDQSTHSACPSCWEHFPKSSPEMLKAHFENDHNVQNTGGDDTGDNNNKDADKKINQKVVTDPKIMEQKTALLKAIDGIITSIVGLAIRK